MPGHGLEESLVRFFLQRMPCLLQNQIYRTGLRIRRLLVTHKFLKNNLTNLAAIGFAFAFVKPLLRSTCEPFIIHLIKAEMFSEEDCQILFSGRSFLQPSSSAAERPK
jgi:hypothetical protein